MSDPRQDHTIDFLNGPVVPREWSVALTEDIDDDKRKGISIFSPPMGKSYKMAFLNSEEPDHPVYLCSLIRSLLFTYYLYMHVRNVCQIV